MNRKYLLTTLLIMATLLTGFAAQVLGGRALAQAGPDAVLTLDANVGDLFTYQGYLQQNGAAANGGCDFEFKLYDAVTGGTQINGTQTRNGTSVAQGRFTVELDFGSEAFNGQARWLEISVRCPAGSGSYTTLSPRQPLTPAPYAHSLRPGAVIEGDVSSSGGILNLTNNGSGSGVRVKQAADGVIVESATNNGLYVIAASNGLRVGSVDTGLLVNSATTGVHVNSSVTGVKVDSASEAGVLVDSALLGVGFQVNSAGKDGLFICATGSEDPNACQNFSNNNGVEVGHAQDYGFYVTRAGIDGLLIDGVGDDGVTVGVAGDDGFYVTEAGGNGFHVKAASQDGLFVCATGNEDSSACDNRTQFKNGVEVLRAEDYGVYVENAGVDGFIVTGASDDGFQAGVITDDGFYVTEAGGNGFHVKDAGVHGLLVEKAGDAGVAVVDAAGSAFFTTKAQTGLNVQTSDNGVYVAQTLTGVFVDGPATNWAGFFTGNVQVTGTCTGCALATMAVNIGGSALQPGDIVALQGSRTNAIAGQPLLMEVTRATAGAQLVGVVYGRGELTEVEKGDGQMATQIVPRAGVAQPGDYVHIVLNGQAQVKASALDATIALGEKLAVADDGAARSLQTRELDGMRIAESAPTIGIALENLASSKDGLIWVLVNPQ